MLLPRFAKKIINYFGFNILNSSVQFPKDFDQQVIDTILKVKPYTQTSNERLFALCEAVKYIVGSQIPGDIVECGVWKGGSMMAILHTLISLKVNDRNLFLFDTFEGMTAPNKLDISIMGEQASDLLKASKKENSESIWCYASLEEVKSNVLDIGYSPEKIHFVKGRVEDTIPENAPENISLLRLDTDWYESTRHELEYLFPRISSGGVLIIDDYGHWQGARKAVDEYIQENKIKILLNRIDYTGRIGIVGLR